MKPKTTKKATKKVTKKATKKKQVDLTPENNVAWEFSVGTYWGVLIGIRTYEAEDVNIHVLYIPFVDFVLRVAK